MKFKGRVSVGEINLSDNDMVNSRVGSYSFSSICLHFDLNVYMFLLERLTKVNLKAKYFVVRGPYC